MPWGLMKGKEDQILTPIKELSNPEVLGGPEGPQWGTSAAAIGQESSRAWTAWKPTQKPAELEPKAVLVCAVQLSVHLRDRFPIQSNPVPMKCFLRPVLFCL